MVELRGINRLFRRHRLLTALVGTTLLLGVAALTTHAALPDHHEAGEAICLCALAIASLAAAGSALLPRCPGALVRRRGERVLEAGEPLAPFAPVLPCTRAGPAGSLVLRR